MINLYIEHNPFTVETKFLVNDSEVAENSELLKFKGQRLQFWIDDFFKNLQQIFNGEKSYKVIFKGTENDCQDMKEAACFANEEQNFDIDIQCMVIEGEEKRLTRIMDLLDEAKVTPLFSKFFDSNESIQANLKEVFNKDFDVFVVATMSSGKSTFINGMLGCDLLPALNEATTATIAKINNNKNKAQGEFEVARISSRSGQYDEVMSINIKDEDQSRKDLARLAEWNADADTHSILIEGNFIGINESENVRLVLTDTPGPNNSQNNNHELVTMKHIQDTDRNPMILYILNATQLGIRDDQGLLRDISNIMKQGGKQSRERFLFILNKADEFDVGKGEDVFKVVQRAKEYLKKNGIDEPRIYPISARLASLFRKRELSSNLITINELGDLYKFEVVFDQIESMNLIQYMPLSNSEKALLEARELPKILKRSGVPGVEVVIENYINKYNLPHRVTRAYEALKEIIKKSSNKSQIEKGLELDEQELGQLKNTLQTLQEKKETAFKTDTFIQELLENETALPDATVEALYNEQSNVDFIIKDLSDSFRKNDEVDVNTANDNLNELDQRVRSRCNSLLAQLEKINESSLPLVKQNLMDAYKQYITSIFESIQSIENLNFPIFESLREQIGDVMGDVFVKDLTSSEIRHHEKEVRGTRMVEKRNPWTLWLTKRYVEETYWTTVNEKKVDLLEVWKNREIEIRAFFEELINKTLEKTEDQAINTTRYFAKVMKKQFDVAFEELLLEINKKIDDQALREDAIEKAKLSLSQISEFEDRLDSILAI